MGAEATRRSSERIGVRIGRGGKVAERAGDGGRGSQMETGVCPPVDAVSKTNSTARRGLAIIPDVFFVTLAGLFSHNNSDLQPFPEKQVHDHATAKGSDCSCRCGSDFVFDVDSVAFTESQCR